jgi:Raf kinase inhibitor-like YbhB/YbcL family protein
MKCASLLLASATFAIVSSACTQSTDSLIGDQGGRETIPLKSSAFEDGGKIPAVHTCDGKDTSPPVSWSEIPKSAKSLALICEDPDAPRGTWTHWVIFDIPTTASALSPSIPATERVKIGSGSETAVQGTNDFGKFGYGGPCPPKGTHHYIFRIFAIDTNLKLPSTTTRADLLRALKGHIVAQGRLTGLYSR